jgi:uncharacterized delta-60 repeat protein
MVAMSRRTLLRACALTLSLTGAAFAAAGPAVAAEIPVDSSFGDGGVAYAALGPDLRPWDPITAEGRDGDLVTALTADSRAPVRGLSIDNGGLYVVRMNADGSAEAGFGTDGVVHVPGLSGDVISMRLLDDGTTVLLLDTLWSDGSTLVAITPAGVATVRKLTPAEGCTGPDTGVILPDGKATITWTCGDGMHVETVSASGADRAAALRVAAEPDFAPSYIVRDSQDRLLAVADGWDDTTRDFVFDLRRFSADGARDTSFTAAHGSGFVNGLAVDSKDRPLVSTDHTNNPWQVRRYTPAGATDDTFAGDGEVTLGGPAFSGNDFITSDPENRILLTGILATGSGNGFLLVRLLEDGTPDESFGPGGQLAVDPEDPDDQPDRRSTAISA